MFSPRVVITPPQNGKNNPSQILPGVRTPPPHYRKMIQTPEARHTHTLKSQLLNFNTFFGLFSRQMFQLTSKSWPTYSSSACPTFLKSPTIDQYHRSTKTSISAKQSLNFQIITKQSICHTIGLHSNRNNYIFIVE